MTKLLPEFIIGAHETTHDALVVAQQKKSLAAGRCIELSQLGHTKRWAIPYQSRPSEALFPSVGPSRSPSVQITQQNAEYGASGVDLHLSTINSRCLALL